MHMSLEYLAVSAPYWMAQKPTNGINVESNGAFVPEHIHVPFPNIKPVTSESIKLAEDAMSLEQVNKDIAVGVVNKNTGGIIHVLCPFKAPTAQHESDDKTDLVRIEDFEKCVEKITRVTETQFVYSMLFPHNGSKYEHSMHIAYKMSSLDVTQDPALALDAGVEVTVARVLIFFRSHGRERVPSFKRMSDNEAMTAFHHSVYAHLERMAHPAYWAWFVDLARFCKTALISAEDVIWIDTQDIAHSNLSQIMDSLYEPDGFEDIAEEYGQLQPCFMKQGGITKYTRNPYGQAKWISFQVWVDAIERGIRGREWDTLFSHISYPCKRPVCFASHLLHVPLMPYTVQEPLRVQPSVSAVQAAVHDITSVIKMHMSITDDGEDGKAWTPRTTASVTSGAQLRHRGVRKTKNKGALRYARPVSVPASITESTASTASTPRAAARMLRF
jgi:hypothetical protein